MIVSTYTSDSDECFVVNSKVLNLLVKHKKTCLKAFTSTKSQPNNKIKKNYIMISNRQALMQFDVNIGN